MMRVLVSFTLPFIANIMKIIFQLILLNNSTLVTINATKEKINSYFPVAKLSGNIICGNQVLSCFRRKHCFDIDVTALKSIGNPFVT